MYIEMIAYINNDVPFNKVLTRQILVVHHKMIYVSRLSTRCNKINFEITITSNLILIHIWRLIFSL